MKKKTKTKARKKPAKSSVKQRRNRGPTSAGRARGNANLLMYKKGKSGNPRGRPQKDATLISMLDEIANWPAPVIPAKIKGVPIDPRDWTFERIVAYRLWVKAANGDVRAIEMIFDRKHGRVPLAIKLPMPPPIVGDGPGLRIEVVDSRKENKK